MTSMHLPEAEAAFFRVDFEYHTELGASSEDKDTDI